MGHDLRTLSRERALHRERRRADLYARWLVWFRRGPLMVAALAGLVSAALLNAAEVHIADPIELVRSDYTGDT